MNSPSPTKIRICHVANGDLWAGAEIQMAILLAGLVRRPGVAVSAVLFNAGRLEHQLRAIGIDVYVFPERQWGGIKIIKSLLEYFQENPCHIVHVHKYKDTILGGLAAKLAGVPCIVRTVHGLTEAYAGFQSVKIGFYRTLEHMVLAHIVSCLIAVSKTIHDVLAMKYKNSQVIHIYNGIEVGKRRISRSRVETRAMLGVCSSEALIGTVGRLTPVKGQVHLLKAMRLLLDQGRKVKLVLVGDGPLRHQLEEMVRKLEMLENVAFLGQRDDTYELMQAMDVFVLPSLSEGIPLVVLEAMVAGVPVLASRVGGIPEVIKDGATGMLVEAGNEVELANRCGMLLDRVDTAAQIAKSARERVEANFSAEVMVDRVAQLYRALVCNVAQQ
ncbi:MAG: glycosyltransferase [Nitrospiraceae bacterium]